MRKQLQPLKNRDGGKTMGHLNLREIVEEVADAIQACPEGLREMAFEILLKYRLGMSRPAAPNAVLTSDNESSTPESGEETSTDLDQDIQARDLHARTRKFLQDHELTLQQINALFYKEEDVTKPLYDDLKSTAMAESQMRLGLLEALENALESGEFEFSGESVREKAKAYKCYDRGNFTRNFKSNKQLFDGFENYDPQQLLKLSTEGKAELARVITELS